LGAAWGQSQARWRTPGGTRQAAVAVVPGWDWGTGLSRVRRTGYGIMLAALIRLGAGLGGLHGKKMEKGKGGPTVRELTQPTEF
jgi:hypothetical protein